ESVLRSSRHGKHALDPLRGARARPARDGRPHLRVSRRAKRRYGLALYVDAPDARAEREAKPVALVARPQHQHEEDRHLPTRIEPAGRRDFRSGRSRRDARVRLFAGFLGAAGSHAARARQGVLRRPPAPLGAKARSSVRGVARAAVPPSARAQLPPPLGMTAGTVAVTTAAPPRLADPLGRDLP